MWIGITGHNIHYFQLIIDIETSIVRIGKYQYPLLLIKYLYKTVKISMLLNLHPINSLNFTYFESNVYYWFQLSQLLLFHAHKLNLFIFFYIFYVIKINIIKELLIGINNLKASSMIMMIIYLNWAAKETCHLCHMPHIKIQYTCRNKQFLYTAGMLQYPFRITYPKQVTIFITKKQLICTATGNEKGINIIEK